MSTKEIEMKQRIHCLEDYFYNRIAILESRIAKLEEIENPKVSKSTGLTFGEALEYAKHGKRISRWRGDDIYVYLQDFGGSTYPELRVKNISGMDAAWFPNHQEILADDWRLLII